MALAISITSIGKSDKPKPTKYNHQFRYIIPNTAFTPGINKTIAVSKVQTISDKFIVLFENKPTLNSECEERMLSA